MTEIVELTATALAEGIRRRDYSAEEVLGAYLRVIDELNPELNAIVSLDPQSALEQARACDRELAAGRRRGPLHGVPVAVKDLIDVAGFPTTHGSRIYRDHRAVTDSVLAGRLRRAGAVFIGKTNVPEFGVGSHTFNEVFGVTRNPYEPTRSAGGSSGGAAAAVAARMLPFADGSDLGGSIRNPCSFGNLFGVRPSAGRVGSGRPGNAYDPGSVLGPMARTVPDTALLLSVIAGPHGLSPLSVDEDPGVFASLAPRSFEGARIAYSPRLDGLPFEPEVTELIDAAAKRLESLGAEVVEVALDLSEADTVFETYRSLEFLGARAGDIERAPEFVKQTLKDDVSWALDLDVHRIVEAAEMRTRLFRRMQGLFDACDLLLAPTAQVLPFPVEVEYPTEVAGVPQDRYYGWQRSCSRITATGMPVLAMPCGFSREGLPVGAQLIGPARSERMLLEYGLTWEAAIADTLRRVPRLSGAHGGG